MTYPLTKLFPSLKFVTPLPHPYLVSGEKRCVSSGSRLILCMFLLFVFFLVLFFSLHFQTMTLSFITTVWWPQRHKTLVTNHKTIFTISNLVKQNPTHTQTNQLTSRPTIFIHFVILSIHWTIQLLSAAAHTSRLMLF